jgi:hypothetical protein
VRKPPLAASKPPLTASKPPLAASKPPLAASEPPLAASTPPFTASELLYIQSVADANRPRAKEILLNGGLVIAGSTSYTKPPLTLKPGKQAGMVACNANVGMLIGAAAARPNESRYFNWQSTIDSGKTIVTAPSTPRGKTILSGLPTMTEIGVRVSMTTTETTTAWTPWVTIVLH